MSILSSIASFSFSEPADGVMHSGVVKGGRGGRPPRDFLASPRQGREAVYSRDQFFYLH